MPITTAGSRLQPSGPSNSTNGRNVTPTAASTYPQHPASGRFHHHRRVAMPLVQRELVHADEFHIAQIHRVESPRQGPLVQHLHRVPV